MFEDNEKNQYLVRYQLATDIRNVTPETKRIEIRHADTPREAAHAIEASHNIKLQSIEVWVMVNEFRVQTELWAE